MDGDLAGVAQARKSVSLRVLSSEARTVFVTSSAISNGASVRGGGQRFSSHRALADDEEPARSLAFVKKVIAAARAPHFHKLRDPLQIAGREIGEHAASAQRRSPRGEPEFVELFGHDWEHISEGGGGWRAARIPLECSNSLTVAQPRGNRTNR